MNKWASVCTIALSSQYILEVQVKVDVFNSSNEHGFFKLFFKQQNASTVHWKTVIFLEVIIDNRRWFMLFFKRLELFI